MKTKSLKLDPQTAYAAQNAKEGLITVADLSILTGMDVGKLNKFAKMGFITHHGEYHGKRFYNFQEIIQWVNRPEEENEIKPVLSATIEAKLRKRDCPYTIEKDGQNVRIVWKDITAR